MVYALSDSLDMFPSPCKGNMTKWSSLKCATYVLQLSFECIVMVPFDEGMKDKVVYLYINNFKKAFTVLIYGFKFKIYNC